jgi:hypothetical protein
MSDIEMSVDVFDLLNGEDLVSKQGEAMMLVTVSEDGWSNTAMISVGEIVAISKSDLRLGLWPTTTTTRNIIRTGKATLILIYNGKVHYIRLLLERIEVLPAAHYERERFAARIVSFREDVAQYAEITSGIQIALNSPVEVVERWKQTVKDLLTS